MKTKIFLLLLLIISGFLRLFLLGTIPHGFANDEIVAVYNAYTIWQTHGFTINNFFLPVNINELSPVPIYIDALFVGIFGLSPFVVRLPYALASMGSAIVLFLLVKKLYKNNFFALFAGLVFSFSPWDIIMGRGAWETNFSIFFYMLGLYLFLKILEKKSVLWSLPAFLLAFYSYNADKIFFLFFIPLLTWLYRKELIRRKKDFTLIILGIFLILFSFTFILKTTSFSRTDTFITKNAGEMQQITNQINVNRAKSSAPMFLKVLFANKPLFIGKVVVDNYIGFFSPQYLFLFGDVNKANGYGMFFWGQMYIIELPFLLIGILVLLAKQFARNTQIFFIGLLCSPLASAITSTIAGTDYFFRGSMAIPFLSFFTGAGMYYSYILLSKKRKQLTLAIGVLFVLCYIFFVSKFIYNYYFQFATYGGDYWTESSKTISYYISQQKGKYTSVYVLTLDKELVLQYAFFNHITPNKVQPIWLGNKNTICNVYFINTCEAMRAIFTKAIHGLFITDPTCIIKNQKSIYTIRDTLEPLQIIWQAYEK